MKLIGSFTSPYVRKTRIVLSEKKIDYTFVENNVWAAATDIARHNPLGKVPCLVLDDGSAVHDSRVITEYLDTLTPLGRLIPTDPRQRAAVRTWEALADGVLDASIAARLEQTWDGRSAGERSQAWVDRQLGKIDAALQAMADDLGDAEYCWGGHYSLADIAVGVALDYLSFRFPAIDWATRHPNLAALAQRLGQRPAFDATRPPA